jgi:hypothetical protein
VAILADVVFVENTVSGPADWRPYQFGIAGGGAVLVFGSDSDGGTTVQVVGCTFINNTVNATDMFPAASDFSGQGSLAKGTTSLVAMACAPHPAVSLRLAGSLSVNVIAMRCVSLCDALCLYNVVSA